MEKNTVRKEKELQTLRARVTELEGQLAEAQAAIQKLTPSNEGRAQTDIPGANEQQQSKPEQEGRFEKAILALPYPIMIWREDSQVVLINAAWTEITGYTLEDIPTLKDWAWKAYGERWTQQLALILNQGFSQLGSQKWGESEVITRSGERRIWDFSTAPLGSDEHGRQLVMAMAVDVTERRRAEQALAESERQQREIARLLELDQARLAAILRHLPVGVWIADQQGRLTGNNEAAQRIWAGELPLFNGIADYDQFVAWYPESGKRLQSEEYPVAMALQTGQSVEPVELKIRRFDKSLGTVLVSAAPIKDEKGQLMGAVSVYVDISERKQAEESLQAARDQAAWLARFPNENPNPVIRSSKTGIVLYCNSPTSNLPGWRFTLNDPLPADLLPVVQQAITQDEMVEQDISLAGRFYSVVAVPIQNESYVNLYGTDITQRKRAEKELAESRQRIADILKSLGDGLFALNREWSIIYINQRAAQIAGSAPDELIGKNLWELWPALLGTPLESFYRQAMEKGLPAQFRVQGNQTSRWYDVSVYPSSEGITIFYVDKTEQIQAEERFNKAFHASPNALVISHQEDGRIETINRTFISFFGYSREEAIGKTSIELGMFVDPAERQEAVHRLQRDGMVRDLELDVRLKSGEIRNASLSVEMIDISGEKLMLTTIQDITLRKQAEGALKKSEQRLNRAQEIAHLGSWELDLINDRLIWSDEVYRIFGLKPQEFGATYEAFLEAVHPEDRAAVDDAYSSSLREGRDSYEIEHRVIKRSSAEIRIVHEKCEHFRNQDGQIIRSVGMVHDITERKQFEIALRKREIILAQAGEMAHLGAWDIELDNQDDVNANPLAWSDEVYRIFGYALGEVQPSNELFFERVHPDDRVLIQESLAQAIATRLPYMIEHRILRPDGEERIVQEHAEIFFDESGKPTRIIGAVQDITEQKQVERALRESEERFHSLADSMPQLVWTALPDGTVDYYNQRHREYREIKQMEGAVWEWSPVLHPEDLPATVEAWRQAVATGDIYQIEHRVRIANGSYRWHLSRGVPMLDEKGQVLRWFGTATDIHDLKLAEEKLKDYAERLERSNRELEQFAFMASHDLQEPLRKIEMFGDLLMERAQSLDEHERNYIERMRNAVERMRAMVAGLLQLSRVATQGGPFVRVNLAQLTSEVLSDLENQIRRTGGKVEVGNLPTLEGDPLQLRQLLQNLIGNALKYHRPDSPPQVQLFAKELSGKVQIFVEDQGIGFEQKDAERIFQPFQRFVSRSEYEGSGIGLSICQRIVERHAGSIAAFSSPGQGTTMIVTLPIHHLTISASNELRKDANNEKPGIASGG